MGVQFCQNLAPSDHIYGDSFCLAFTPLFCIKARTW